MSWTLHSQTKTDLLTAASDIQTAIETLASKVSAYNSAWETAQAEIWAQDESHLGDASLAVGWPRDDKVDSDVFRRAFNEQKISCACFGSLRSDSL